jgi:amino acid transporter, AAT family
VIILVQGWSSFSPKFSGVDFVSYYIELPVMLIMYGGWKLLKRTKLVRLETMDLETDVHKVGEEDSREEEKEEGLKGKIKAVLRWIF